MYEGEHLVTAGMDRAGDNDTCTQEHPIVVAVVQSTIAETMPVSDTQGTVGLVDIPEDEDSRIPAVDDFHSGTEDNSIKTAEQNVTIVGAKPSIYAEEAEASA